MSSENDSEPDWHFWIDVGGTFTDCLARRSDSATTEAFFQTKVLSSGLTKGRIRREDEKIFLPPDQGDGFWDGAEIRFLSGDGSVVGASKVASYDSATGEVQFEVNSQSTLADGSSQGHYELDFGLPAPLVAIHRLLRIPPSETLPACSIHLGTTRGTNALLTRSGAKTALVTTKGFRDLLLIGDQARPHLFELTIKKPAPLFETSVEIDERILADGTVEKSPDVSALTETLLQLRSQGIESVAVCLMHGFQFPQNEQVVGDIAKSLGFQEVRLSSEVAPLIKIVPRAETTVLDAYLNPILGDYLDSIEEWLAPGSELQLMTSSGGLVDRDRFSGKDSVLSGPAGGIVGAARVAQQAGFQKVLTFDMGGTSSDVGRFDGEIELEFESRKSDVRIMTPMVAIETVAAGGGSICRFDGTKLVVGPQSAGSDPGPACYGRGGPLAVTDINLFLGRIVRSKFPFPLDESAVTERLTEIQHRMRTAGFDFSLPEIAFGFLEIANQNMASAVRSISIAKGYDPKDYALVAFGGAGPQHGCAVADAIGSETILDHPQGSILSAVGIRLADQTSNLAKSILRPLNKSSMDIANSAWSSMQSVIQAELGEDSVQWQRSLDLRYEGTDASLTVTWKASADFEQEFHQHHHQLYGFQSDRPIEIVAARLQGKKLGNRLSLTQKVGPQKLVKPDSVQTLWQKNNGELQRIEVPVFDRSKLEPGMSVEGPAVIASELSTTIVDSGWKVTMHGHDQLVLSKHAASHPAENEKSLTAAKKANPIQLEIFNNHFSSIARQMGIALQKTSMSVNVKERLDFSCAIFTATGDLVVNAPHIPVHLGAMSETVRHTIRFNPKVSEGDVFVTNDPFAGGSHLPDVTVVTPVFDDEKDLVFWVASRSHHAEIGGIAPGSMPAGARNLAQEGVLIRNFHLVNGESGSEHFEDLFKLLSSSPYPSRAPLENIADIRAQVASNRSGQQDLMRLIKECGKKTVLAYMGHIQFAAESKVRNALLAMQDGSFRFEDALDNGATIRVEIEKTADQLTIDFRGTDPVLDGNMNANPAIVASAIIYVMRCLIEQDIPLNEGVLKPVTLKLPECFLNPSHDEDPENCPAVVGGNVETSQRVVDVLLGALQQAVPDKGLAAASQGTMNNWLMGDNTFGYYETVGGGSGATSLSVGADAVHCHMTNTRLTDPEVLEIRYPAILREFAIRSESGGRGFHCGGNGMIREVEFCQPLTLSLLTNRRTSRPYGIVGGQPGMPGVNQLTRSNGGVEVLPAVCEILVEPGDRLRLETPGGGGWGEDK